MITDKRARRISSGFLFALAVGAAGAVQAFEISFSEADFTTTTVFSNVATFSFAIDIDEPFAPGNFNNPALNGVSYAVSGSLVSGTPSGFPAFALQRTIGGDEFYLQGSSLSFEIAAGADLSDGLQLSELAGTTDVFVFNGHENNTGRFHPALLRLNSDGTGSIRNSDNMGAGPGKNIDVDFGAEYITELTFDPAAVTLVAAVPLPAAAYLLGSALLLGGIRQRRRSSSL